MQTASLTTVTGLKNLVAYQRRLRREVITARANKDRARERRARAALYAAHDQVIAAALAVR